MPQTLSHSRATLVGWFHALSDETRLDILHRLKDGELCVCELTDALHTGQSRLSFHLKVLKEAGLIHDRPEGRWVYYSINHDVLVAINEAIVSMRTPKRLFKPGSRC